MNYQILAAPGQSRGMKKKHRRKAGKTINQTGLIQSWGRARLTAEGKGPFKKIRAGAFKEGGGNSASTLRRKKSASHVRRQKTMKGSKKRLDRKTCAKTLLPMGLGGLGGGCCLGGGGGLKRSESLLEDQSLCPGLLGWLTGGNQGEEGRQQVKVGSAFLDREGARGITVHICVSKMSGNRKERLWCAKKKGPAGENFGKWNVKRLHSFR